MATLIWTEPAVADLEEIGQFISQENPLAAEKVGSRIIREAENVAAFPRLGRIVPEFGNPELREIVSQSYRVIYKFDEEGDLVAILRIWHGAKPFPGDWQYRILFICTGNFYRSRFAEALFNYHAESATIPPEIENLCSWVLREPNIVQIGVRRSVPQTVTHAFYPVA